MLSEKAKAWMSLGQAAECTVKNCFDHIYWDLFVEATTYGTVPDLEEYTNTVLSYINICVGNVTVERYANLKHWME